MAIQVVSGPYTPSTGDLVREKTEPRLDDKPYTFVKTPEGETFIYCDPGALGEFAEFYGCPSAAPNEDAPVEAAEEVPNEDAPVEGRGGGAE